MRYDEAVKLHKRFVAAAIDDGFSGAIVRAVIALHAPTGMPAFPADEPCCFGCPPGEYAESMNAWEDCLTLKTMNTWFRVDGYPSGIEAPAPIVCEPIAPIFCPIHGRCTCRMERFPYRVIPARACPLHGESGVHTNRDGSKVREW